MNSPNAAILINLLGFTVGIALYVLLAAMVLRHRGGSRQTNTNNLLLATALLGLLWNMVELFVLIQRDFGSTGTSSLVTAASYSALGFLPSVVVHSARLAGKAKWLTIAAYALSTFAAVLHFQSAISIGRAPSDLALKALTVGAAALAAGLLIYNFRRKLEKKSIWMAALLIFAASAFHLSGDREERSWIIELGAHQSSLPLALTILYQNYRFAFADLFLKRAISLILLALTAFGLYVWVAAPLLRYHETHDRNDVQAISLILTLWIATALVYPALHRLAVLVVDRLLLDRADYSKLQIELANEFEKNDSIEEILDRLSSRLAEVLTASRAEWTKNDSRDPQERFVLVDHEPDSARLMIPTAESPFFTITLGDFHGGRRLLSEETTMLDAVSLLAARRIDALRVTHERCDQALREQEFSKLAAEAQLTALRSQVNPHFLFNALTTIGYLIKTSPEKAYDTLLQLTQLLRGVLKSTGEFSTLGDEIKLVESYLDIERARFEEKLAVSIDIPKELENIKLPSLILQPVVENAIKHAISENINGGEVKIFATHTVRNGDSFLRLAVWDSGPGIKGSKAGGSGGFGLRNIRERLESYYGDKATFIIEKDFEKGTLAEITFALNEQINKEEKK